MSCNHRPAAAAATGEQRAEPAAGTREGGRKRHRQGRRLTPTLRGGDAAWRLCCVCRTQKDRLALIQLKDKSQAGGRRAYCCIERRCLLAALGGPAGELALHDEARLRLGQCLGLARRAGEVLLGAAAMEGLSVPPGAVVLMANDAAARTTRQFPPGAKEAPFGARELGQLVGRAAPIAGLLVARGRHAQQAAYWRQVWYETRPERGQRQIEVGQ